MEMANNIKASSPRNQLKEALQYVSSPRTGIIPIVVVNIIFTTPATASQFVTTIIYVRGWTTEWTKKKHSGDEPASLQWGE